MHSLLRRSSLLSYLPSSVGGDCKSGSGRGAGEARRDGMNGKYPGARAMGCMGAVRMASCRKKKARERVRRRRRVAHRISPRLSPLASFSLLPLPLPRPLRVPNVDPHERHSEESCVRSLPPPRSSLQSRPRSPRAPVRNLCLASLSPHPFAPPPLPSPPFHPCRSSSRGPRAGCWSIPIGAQVLHEVRTMQRVARAFGLGLA